MLLVVDLGCGLYSSNLNIWVLLVRAGARFSQTRRLTSDEAVVVYDSGLDTRVKAPVSFPLP